MVEFHRIWIEQCQATRRIRDEYGVEKALGYLIGEKMVSFMREAEERPEFSRELPNFVAEIKRIFDRFEIAENLNGVKRLGALGQTLTDEQYTLLEEAESVDETPVQWAQDILVIERIKELLLG